MGQNMGFFEFYQFFPFGIFFRLFLKQALLEMQKGSDTIRPHDDEDKVLQHGNTITGLKDQWWWMA
jgi:hypothetical protein